jgi:hypothetical protein
MNATRAQVAKIVSNAAGFSDSPCCQMFADVDTGNTFYAVVQRLASRGVISGYPCGSPGEPCLPPENLPYFRPSMSVTRGQTSKIVANTFFPVPVPAHQVLQAKSLQVGRSTYLPPSRFDKDRQN